MRRVDGPEQQNILVHIPWSLGVGRHTDAHPFLKSRQSLDTTSIPRFNYLRHLPLNLDLLLTGFSGKSPPLRSLNGISP